jgi:E1-E2 ATPase/Cation transporter/ATPase, N-terminus
MDRLLWRRRVSPGTIARWVEAARGGVPGLVTSSPEANPPSGFAAKNALGLSSADARARLVRDGPNVLPSPAPPSAWRDLAAQMVHFFALMLWFAGALAFLAGMPQLGVAIFVVVIVNGVFAFAQESRAEHAAERLRDLLPRRATVLRDGVVQDIDAAGLVTTDVVLLGAGDRVSADLRVIEAHTLAVNTSLLTGESEPVPVNEGDGLSAGTFVVEGEGRAVVEATGARTRLAAIALLTRAGRRPRSPLAQELHRVVGFAAFGRLSLRDWRDGCARPGRAAADGDAVAGNGCTADGRSPRADPSIGIGRDARFDDVHLHRQDRHADLQRDGRRGGVDPGWGRKNCRQWLRPDRGVAGRRGRPRVAQGRGPCRGQVLHRSGGAAGWSLGRAG